jgi:glycerol kinase
MQFEADMTGLTVARTDTAELSALGVAHLAGLAAGLFTIDGLARLDRGGTEFAPAIDAASRAAKRAGWARALARSRS